MHLVDSGDDLGGCMRWVTRLPGLGEWGRVIDYRRVQIDRLANLEFVPNTPLDATRPATTAPRSSWWRPARTGRRTA